MASVRDDSDQVPLLETSGLSSFRGDRLLFEDLALRIDTAEIVQIHGANGSGKTTLLRILCGLMPPSEGRLRWRGREVQVGAPEVRAEIQYIGHSGGVKLELTPLENLAVAIALAPESTGTSAIAALARLEVDNFHDVPARMLSAGQRRRIALARLLTCRASLWVLDEPFTALDTSGVRVIDGMLRDHANAGGAAIITSHHPVALEGVTPRLVQIGRPAS